MLIDELDLHLHPVWQQGLIAGLKHTFPRLQFVATTHSPLLLSGLEDELYNTYFGVERDHRSTSFLSFGSMKNKLV